MHVRGSYLDPLLPAFADPIFLFSVDQIARRERLQGGNAEVLQYAPERERTVQSAVSCHESHLRLAHWQPVAVRRQIEIEECLGLSVPTQASKTDDLALECLKARVGGRRRRNGQDRCSPFATEDAPFGALPHDAPHGFDETSRIELPGSPVGDHFAVLHHDDPVGG